MTSKDDTEVAKAEAELLAGLVEVGVAALPEPLRTEAHKAMVIACAAMITKTMRELAERVVLVPRRGTE